MKRILRVRIVDKKVLKNDQTPKAELAEFKTNIEKAFDFIERSIILVKTTDSERKNFPEAGKICQSIEPMLAGVRAKIVQVLNEIKDEEKYLKDN